MHSMSEYVQYKQVDHHILRQGTLLKLYFPMNEALHLLIYLAKTVSGLW